MIKNKAWIWVGGVLVVCGIAKMIYDSEMFQLTCVLATRDGKKYCVRSRAQVKPAVNLLSQAVEKCTRLVSHVNDKYPEDEDVQRLVEKFRPEKVMETLPTSVHTAYSENKGEKVAFCLNRFKDNNDELIDLETLTFVAIHELAHIMTKSEGHESIFWENFKFLLMEAHQAGIHQPVNYKERPAEYCGMQIQDNPFFDL
jgi:hypothetical protein